ANLFILPLGRNETPGERLGRSGAGMQFKCPLHRPVHRLENLDQGLLTGPLIPAEQADLVRPRLAQPPAKAVLLLLRPEPPAHKSALFLGVGVMLERRLAYVHEVRKCLLAVAQNPDHAVLPVQHDHTQRTVWQQRPYDDCTEYRRRTDKRVS